MRHGVLALAVTALLAGATAAAAVSTAKPKPRVTVIGDSIAESFDYVPAARRYLERGLDVRSDAAPCRRLVAASCAYRGAQPKTALEVVSARRGVLGDVVVINVGYNDWSSVYDVDRVLDALEAARVPSVVWVTLRATTENYAHVNARIAKAKRRWEHLAVADWNSYSRGKSWFRPDGLHLTVTGAHALARLLRPLVLAGLRRS